MMREQILTKAIEKAQENGWYPTVDFIIAAYDGSIGTSAFLMGTYEDDGQDEEFRRDVETLIYQPYFAKALWGNEPAVPTGRTVMSEKGPAEYLCEAWAFHLQQMVIADDPIAYLGEHL